VEQIRWLPPEDYAPDITVDRDGERFTVRGVGEVEFN
jgi:hypothetical protein